MEMTVEEERLARKCFDTRRLHAVFELLGIMVFFHC